MLNTSSYLTIFRIPGDEHKISSGIYQSERLKNAKTKLNSASEKLQLARESISATYRLINSSADHFKKHQDIIDRCMQRFDLIDQSLRYVYISDQPAAPAEESEPEILNPVENILVEPFQKPVIKPRKKQWTAQNNVELKLYRHHIPIDINIPQEVQFWSKKFNVCRTELINAITLIGSAIACDVEDYFQKLNAIPVQGNPS